jgi:hypothetical protein
MSHHLQKIQLGLQIVAPKVEEAEPPAKKPLSKKAKKKKAKEAAANGQIQGKLLQISLLMYLTSCRSPLSQDPPLS